MPETIIVKGDNLTLDALLTRRFGLQGSELMARTMVLNPGLPPVLVVGTKITLPDLPPEQATKPVPVVTLFGNK